MKIITGGQSGADLAGNYFAKKHGIETEINTFNNFKPSYDELPFDIKINYVCDKKDYSQNLRCRTKYNVLNSDITLILLSKPIELTRGSKLTMNYCKEFNKKYVYVNIYNCIGNCSRTLAEVKYAVGINISPVINVSGQRELCRIDSIKFLEKVLIDEIKR